jgi:hypothetical protein
MFFLGMKRKEFWLGAIGGTVGGVVGSVSGSSSLFVVGCVGAGIGFLVVWLAAGFLK